MKISDRNFMASQCFYGLAIAKQAELPALHETGWEEALDRLTRLARIAADKQMAENRRTRKRRK